MSQTIRLTRKQAAPILAIAFPDYEGQRLGLKIAQRYRVASYQLCWDGWCKTGVCLVLNREGRLETAELTALAPWDGKEWAGEIPADGMIVERTYFGQIVMVTIYVAPGSNFLPKILPAAEQQALAA